MSQGYRYWSLQPTWTQTNMLPIYGCEILHVTKYLGPAYRIEAFDGGVITDESVCRVWGYRSGLAI